MESCAARKAHKMENRAGNNQDTGPNKAGQGPCFGLQGQAWLHHGKAEGKQGRKAAPANQEGEEIPFVKADQNLKHELPAGCRRKGSQEVPKHVSA